MTDIHARLAEALDFFEENLKESREAIISPDKRWRVAQLIDALALIANSPSGEVNHAFRTPSRETTQTELYEIATRASDLAERLRDPKCSVKRSREQLAQRLEAMHGTTICALSLTPAFVIHNEPALLNVAFARCELPALLRAETTDRERLANELDFLAQAAATAEAPDTADEGRWPDYRAQAVARILARFYYDATGLRPTISTIVSGPNEGQHYGPFFDLFGLIFEAMSIEREAFSYARRAADELRARAKVDPINSL
jgi:hypothetical protein